MLIEVRITDDDIDRIAARVLQMLSAGFEGHGEHWLDVGGASAHVGLTENAIRGLVKRRVSVSARLNLHIPHELAVIKDAR
jgi:hypothetical protein